MNSIWHSSRRAILGALVGGISDLALGAPAAALTRKQLIASTLAGFEIECRKNAAGDWERYFASTLPFRNALWPRITNAFDHPFKSPENPSDGAPLVSLYGKPGFYHTAHQLTDITAAHPGYVSSVRDFVDRNPTLPIIEQASGWLRKQGIEVVFVPGPTPPYMDFQGLVSDETLLPAHGMIAPHGRAVLKNLCERDVEVVDVLPDLLVAQKAGTPGTIIRNDTHWGAFAHRRAAALVAKRLMRLPLVQRAVSAAPKYAEKEESYDLPASLTRYLEPETRAISDRLRATRGLVVRYLDGQEVKPVPDSSVLVIGDSFTDYGLPLGAAFSGCLARFINQPVSLIRFDGHTDHAFREMARNPDILKPVKAVVWIANQGSFVSPMASGWPKEWKIPPVVRKKA